MDRGSKNPTFFTFQGRGEGGTVKSFKKKKKSRVFFLLEPIENERTCYIWPKEESLAV